VIVDNLLAIGTLVFLEAVLSGDNAVVLAVLAKPLPEQLRRKALFYGLGGALAMRAVAILVAKWLIGLWWVQGVAALLLGYLSVGHLITAASKRGGLAARFSGRTFWGRVAMIELADFAFAIDSVLIAVALSEHLWVIYTGAAIGIAAMRFAAGFVLALITRFPQIEVAAYALVGWTATKLLLSALGESTLLRSTDAVPESLMPQWLFWLGAILIITAGTCLAYGGRPRPGLAKSARECAAPFTDESR
jgi:YkoY family integral membrane protein